MENIWLKGVDPIGFNDSSSNILQIAILDKWCLMSYSWLSVSHVPSDPIFGPDPKKKDFFFYFPTDPVQRSFFSSDNCILNEINKKKSE